VPRSRRPWRIARRKTLAAATNCRRSGSRRTFILEHHREDDARRAAAFSGSRQPLWVNQVLSSRVQQWSWQPCVRPASAVHMTAGHNALRGSGPGQMPAFDNALAEVGCPDRRIDRLCITCCSPFPTVASRRMPDAISVTPPVRRVPYSARRWSRFACQPGPRRRDPVPVRTSLCGNATRLWAVPDPNFGY
jgi:hypothetical protein